MATGTAALVDAGGVVVNRIVYDPAADYVPAEGLTVIEETIRTGTSTIGGTWDGTEFHDPPELTTLPSPEQPKPEPKEKRRR